MDKELLIEAVSRLASQESSRPFAIFAYEQAVRQFNSLLEFAKVQYPQRVDIEGINTYGLPTQVRKEDYQDALNRLKAALEIESSTSKPSEVGRYGIPELPSFKKEISKYAETDLVSCLFIDLDNFKAVNDQHKHTVGDRVIQETIRITELAIKGKGKIFHRSGDEILILLPNFDGHEACAVAERIRQTIEQHEFDVIGKAFITATIGISTSNFCTLADLEVSADTVAMDAKKNGKNQVVHCGLQMERVPVQHKATKLEIASQLSEYMTQGDMLLQKEGDSAEWERVVQAYLEETLGEFEALDWSKAYPQNAYPRSAIHRNRVDRIYTLLQRLGEITIRLRGR